MNRHDITDILLKVVLNTINPSTKVYIKFFVLHIEYFYKLYNIFVMSEFV